MCSIQFDATYRRQADQNLPDLQKLKEELWKKYDEYAAKYFPPTFDWALVAGTITASPQGEVDATDIERPPSPKPEDDQK